LFNRDSLSAVSFRDIIEKHLPGSRNDVNLWLATTKYPERFRLAAVEGIGR
jgi:hypothetical protein